MSFDAIFFAPLPTSLLDYGISPIGPFEGVNPGELRTTRHTEFSSARGPLGQPFF